MDNFGIMLMSMFVAKACPTADFNGVDRASWEDVVKLFFENAEMVREVAVKSDHIWTPESVEELDRWLMEVAEAGQFLGEIKVPAIAAEELYRRWKYAIVGAQLEAEAGSQYSSLVLPLNVPEDIGGIAVILYFLGGAARSYPKEMFET